jgi:prophage maintenance system killer protein
MEKGEVIIYRAKDGSAAIDVKLEKESVWLSLNQISELFGRDKSVISKHLSNIYDEGEVDRISTVAKNATVQTEGDREITRDIDYYNLDAILSVGYRVNSKRGTEFRIWANKILREHLVQGYTLNEKRLKEQSRQIEELKETVRLLGNVIENNSLGNDEGAGILKVISDYTYALDLLDQYDHQTLEIQATTPKELFQISYEEAIKTINDLREKFGAGKLFGNEKDESFQSSLVTIYQCFNGKDLYPSVEEKAAQLLYFIVKNHSFTDGNKRIAAFLFVWFMEKNGILYKQDGNKRIADNALVAVTIMMAESKPEEKEMMTKLVVNLINTKN